MFKKITTAFISITVMLLIPINSFAGRGGGGMGGGGMGGGGRTAGGIAGGFAGGAGGTTSIVGTDESSISLIPWPEKRWIIVRAPAEYMDQIAELIKKFDIEDSNGDGTPYETYNVRYVDVDELATTLTTILAESDIDFQRNVSIQPLATSRQLLVFGKKEYRDLVSKILLQIDLPSNQLQRKTFQLKYADPEDIKTKIDEIFSLTGSTSTSTSRTTTTRTAATRTSGTGIASLSSDTVITTTYTSLRQIVVLASQENMLEIEKQISEWDSPIVWAELKPRIISVKNIDPVQLVTLLNTLFSSSSTTSGTSSSTTRNLLSATGSSTATALGESIIGPLYGKLTFISIPDTRKFIVASNVKEAYEAVELFVKEIDAEDPAVVPKVVPLKYADPEDLSQRLNTVFAESGTGGNITMSAKGLSSNSYIDDTQDADASEADEWEPPWAGSGGTTDDEMPVSNVFGKVRFMPEPNTKSILLLAPAQFMPDLEVLIGQLDVTGKQVMIETIIVEVEHNTMTSLGFEFSSAGSALSTLGRYGANNSIVLGNPTDHLGFETGLQLSDDLFISGINLTTFVDFLKKNGDARILNQQTLWTKDNEEANFFKGKQIPFVTGTTETTSSTGAVVSSDTFEFQLVGMEVRVRPRITPENNVGMVINVNYSQQTGDKGLGNMDILSQMNSTTNMIIQDGDTLILGGILFQKDSTITYKIPGLGDIPWLGKLFSHDSINKENTELLVFIKPSVIDEAPENLEALAEKTKAVIENSRSRMEQIRSELDKSMSGIKKD